LKTLNKILAALLLVIASQANAQVKSTYAETPPVIDGVLDEAMWKQSKIATDYKTFVPDYSKDMPYETVTYMAHDEENLYFAFKAFDDPTLVKTSISARDKIRADDWIAINLDSFDDSQSLYGFYVNPNGIQMDSRFAAGKDDYGIDMIWYSAGKMVDDGYVLEIQIPFKSIRYTSKAGDVNMGVIFERKISRFSIQGSYPALDPKQGMNFLIQTLPLEYDRVKKAVLLEILPAVTYANNRSQEQGEYVSEDNFEPSLTMKYGLTSDLVLDLTINPDFSQVEADASRVEVNQRFAVNYPEKRPFFLEGNEQYNFASSGMFSPIRKIVNTRSIVAPRGATKLTGKIGDKNIVSAIYAVDRADESLADYDEAKTANVGVLRYKRAFSQDNYLGFVGTTRTRNGANNFVYGFDGQFRVKQANQFGAYIFNSSTRELEGGPTENRNSYSFNFSRNTRNFSGSLNYVDIEDGFQSDVGIVNRTGIRKITSFLSPKIYPKKGAVKRIDLTLYLSGTKDIASDLNEGTVYTSVRATLPKSTSLSLTANRSTEIYSAQSFDKDGVSISASSQITKRIYFRTNYSMNRGIYYGTAEQGYGKRISASVNWQLSDKFKAEMNHNFSSLYNSETDAKFYDVHILRGKFIYQANKYLFFRTIIQYNSLSEVLAPNFLASFTYIPGTVVHLGYGSIYEKTEWDGNQYVDSDKFLDVSRGLFFKASYLFRY
jgi:uncharacterized protein DUF5916/cellulose/xylan binding protein with CBM9 domain